MSISILVQLGEANVFKLILYFNRIMRIEQLKKNIEHQVEILEHCVSLGLKVKDDQTELMQLHSY